MVRETVITYSRMGTAEKSRIHFTLSIERTASKKTANQIDSTSGICSWIRSWYRVGVLFEGQPVEILVLPFNEERPFCK